MEHQPNNDKQITLTPDPQVLAKFILSLLQQPRRIEQEFRNNIFTIDYEWCRNLIEICEHRMDKHNYSICSFSCNIFYETSRVDNISTKEAFYAYLDGKTCRSVGVDLSISFLVLFGTKTEPEKQDLRVQIFSDESYKFLVTPRNKIEPESVISYSISFSNLTWGEDVSRHINTHIETALKKTIFTKLLVQASAAASKTSTMVIFPITFLVSIFVSNKQFHRYIDLEKRNFDEFNLILNVDTMESISKKLNIIRQDFFDYIVTTTSGFGWMGLILMFGTIIATAPYIAQLLTRRFCVSFVMFNDYTRTLSTKYIATNEKLKWLVISAVVGIPVALVTAYIKGLFSL